MNNGNSREGPKNSEIYDNDLKDLYSIELRLYFLHSIDFVTQPPIQQYLHTATSCER